MDFEKNVAKQENLFKGRDVISIKDISRQEIDLILSVAQHFKNGKKIDMSSYVMASLFYEPSSRTKNSFEIAMKRLGGKVIGFAGTEGTSVMKGESLHDTIKMFELYSDFIVLRHPKDGSAQWAADVSKKPVINAGDGKNQHPTQTLLDLFSIKETQGRIEGLNVAMVGDLKYGRTVHSLAVALSLFNCRLFFISPESLRMPDYVKELLRQRNIEFSEHEKIEEVEDKADIIYMTRIQRERFSDDTEYNKVRGVYILKKSTLRNPRPQMKILHPLPRVNEISMEIDNTPHAYYFEQAENGIFVRQALIALVTGVVDEAGY